MNKSIFLKYDRVSPEIIADPLSDLIISEDELKLFNPENFGIGNFSIESTNFTALAVIFDLEGFTTFCSQNDPQLFVPHFVNEFVEWLFKQIIQLSIDKNIKDSLKIKAPLPFYSKFLGDGLLFLWKIDKENINDYCLKNDRNILDEVNGDIGHILSILHDITNNFNIDFYPKLNAKYSRLPRRLRCGVAQGLVCSLGGGSDYIGPCINMASRLQKNELSDMCILVRGIDPSSIDNLEELFVRVKIEVRGTGEELVYVIKKQYDEINKSSKQESEVIADSTEMPEFNRIQERLSKFSKEILKEVSISSDGILRIVNHKNGFIFQTSNKQLNQDSEPRTRAKIESSIEELLLNKCIQKEHPNNNRYKITERGYLIADSI